MIKLTDKKQLQETMEQRDETLVFFYAPMCGTCEIARSYIEIVEKTDDKYSVYEIDLNFLKDEARQWEVQSVPCLIKFKGMEPVRKMYAFESVTNVFEWIKQDYKKLEGEVR